MLADFLKYAGDNGLFKTDSRILLGVSGGMDSMVMTHLFLAAGYRTGIAHCNFCLRGEESDLDEELVRNFADKKGIPFYSKRFDTKGYSKSHGISVQMAARDLRFEWFEKIREENSFDSIAIAHNINDSIETMLINLARGTGLTGLTGLKPSAGRIVRPLLFATRSRISQYCNEQRISIREDRSNPETKYTRNKIRHLVIPVLREINPSIEHTLSKTAESLAGLDRILNEYISGLREQITISRDPVTILDAAKVLELTTNKALIFELFSPYGITRATSDNFTDVVHGGSGGQIITPTHRIVKNRNELIIAPVVPVNKIRLGINSPGDLLSVRGVRSVEVLDFIQGADIPDDRHIAYLDFAAIRFPMTVRNWERGDYFYPLGMDQKKKLSDYFTDRKFSLIDKEQALLLVSSGRIAWIIGERIDDRFKVTGSTVKVLRIEAERKI
ncbi:MAG: tRNA lysidine(34) synthetase TilS [Bacteroidales bacterium]